jgi:hydroxymethylbilane synthase
MSDEPIRLATRGSDLALWQAGEVRTSLADRRVSAELVEIDTEGDQIRDELIHRLGKVGAFVRALDEAILDGRADAAVHSMKDVPTEGGEDLVIAAVPERGPAGDVLVTPDGTGLEDLPRGAVVGTGSLRRGAQLRAARPDLAIEPVRGNVDTRVEKLLAPPLQAEHERRSEAESEQLEEIERETRTGAADRERETGGGGSEEAGDSEDGAIDREYDRTVEEWFERLAEVERAALGRAVETKYDALVLAAAGLRRTGLERHVGTHPLPTGEFVPAAGQGALAVTAADGDLAESLREVLDHPRSRVETSVERTVLAAVGGGCIAPIGVHATLRGDVVHVDARVLSTDGTEEAALSRDLPVDDYRNAAREAAADLRADGAADLIEVAREDADADGRADAAADAAPDADSAERQQ